LELTAMNKLRVGIIGLGIGRSHIRSFQSHPGAEVVAIADPDETRLKVSGEEGLIVMELLDAIYESAASGKPVPIKP
jgi:predicted dehydrogenase